MERALPGDNLRLSTLSCAEDRNDLLEGMTVESDDEGSLVARISLAICSKQAARAGRALNEHRI